MQKQEGRTASERGFPSEGDCVPPSSSSDIRQVALKKNRIPESQTTNKFKAYVCRLMKLHVFTGS